MGGMCQEVRLRGDRAGERCGCRKGPWGVRREAPQDRAEQERGGGIRSSVVGVPSLTCPLMGADHAAVPEAACPPRPPLDWALRGCAPGASPPPCLHPHTRVHGATVVIGVRCQRQSRNSRLSVPGFDCGIGALEGACVPRAAAGGGPLSANCSSTCHCVRRRMTGPFEG